MSNPTFLLSVLPLAVLTLFCSACGGDPTPSGKYSVAMDGGIMAFDFKGDGKVVSSISEGGMSESKDCTYQTNKDTVTVHCPGGSPMQMAFQDGALQADIGDVILKFSKQ